MSKEIHICEYCGILSGSYFGQCKNCDTHSDGSKYVNFNKIETKKISREDLLSIINNCNKYVVKKGLKDLEMNKKQFEKELEKFRKTIMNDIDSKINEKTSNIVDENKIKKMMDDVNEMHKRTEHKCDNEINKKIIDSKLSENQSLKIEVARLEKVNRKLQDTISENSKLEFSIDDYQLVKLDVDKLTKKIKLAEKEVKVYKKVNIDLTKQIDDLEKQLIKPASWTKDEDKLLEKLDKKFKKLKGSIKDVAISEEFIKLGHNRNSSSIQRRRYRIIKKK